MFTALSVLTPPTQEPITLDLLQSHLRLDQNFDDPLLSGYLIAARASAETFLGRALMTQTLQMTASYGHESGLYMGWYGRQDASAWHHRRRATELSRCPVQSIVSFAVLDHLGNTTATQLTNAATPSGSTLQFAAIGCPAAAGQFVQDLTAPGAIAAGVTVLGVATAGGVATVTLSSQVAAAVGSGDNILFSSIASQPANSSPVTAALALTGGSLYIADLTLEPARIRPDWIHVISALGTVSFPIQHEQFVFVAGYSAVANIPQPIISAILLTTAWLYERRGDEPGERPDAAEWLLAPYRVQFFA